MSAPVQSTRISTWSLTGLLHAASQDRTDLHLADFREVQIRWAIETGLGPLLRRATAADPGARDTPLWPLIEGADLAARVIADEQLRAVEDIIQACEGQMPPLTLLKGVSICAQHYPERHLRPMRDIDILVDQEAVPIVEDQLHRLGYFQPSPYPPEWLEGSHHIAPFCHPDTGIWVEVHRKLFSSNSEVSSEWVFGPQNLRAERVAMECQGRPVNRFSDELQLVYIATHWALGFMRAGGVVAMLDLIYLLRNSRAIRWERIFEWLDDSCAATYVYLLLSYLDRHHLVDIEPGVLDNLFGRQRSFGRTNLAVLHSILDRYVVDGYPFSWLMSVRNINRVWDSLLRPGRPSRNALLGLWSLLPYSITAAQAVSRLRGR
jgi:putative nucleotidyltransferase-like protein